MHRSFFSTPMPEPIFVPRRRKAHFFVSEPADATDPTAEAARLLATLKEIKGDDENNTYCDARLSVGDDLKVVPCLVEVKNVDEFTGRRVRAECGELTLVVEVGL